MQLEDFKDKIVCGTGHRPHKLGGYGQDTFNSLVKCATYALERIKPRLVISGMALGWDQALAQAAINLGIPFDAYCPTGEVNPKWGYEAKQYYAYLLSMAREVKVISKKYTFDCMQRRNEWMVDDCDLVIALWDGSSGGTANCINYAKEVKRPWANLWPRWEGGEFK